jgi:fused signal recognition particle receptor
MDPTLIIALVVVAVVAVAFFIARGKQQPALPPKTETEAEASSHTRPADARPAQPADARKATALPRLPAPEPGTATPAEAVRGSEPASELDSPDLTELPTPPRPAGSGTVPPPPPTSREHAPAKASAEDVATLRRGLSSTRGGFIARLSRLFSGKREIDPALLDQIEEVLITADVGAKTTARILDRLRDRMTKRELVDEDRVWAAIREEARAILAESRGHLKVGHKPAVVLVIGVNGVGKTTTTGKLASRFSAQGKRVLLVAADTFRAAAVLQLEVWGKRIGCPVARGKENADPSSVVFDALKRAEAEGVDLVMVDTAGRLHTKAPLMEELKKLGRTVEKALGRPADEVLLVLDSTNGQNALQQVALFRDALPITGIALTKLDGTAKGGMVLGIVEEQKLPIRFIGIGERVEDLRDFDPESFVDALFERSDSEPSAG